MGNVPNGSEDKRDVKDVEGSMFQVGKALVPFPELRVYDDTGNVVSGSIDVVVSVSM